MIRSVIVHILLLFLLLTGCKDVTRQPSTSSLDSIPSNPIIETEIDDTYNNVGRAIWQKPGLVIEKLGNLSDKVVADIGAGTGYFSFRLATKAKKVIAIEIEEGLVNYIDSTKIKLPEDKRSRLETRLAKSTDPNLNNDEVDIILIINTIAYIEDLPKYLLTLKKGLKQNGTLMIIDYKMKRLPINAPPKTERIYLDKLEDMLLEAGYDVIQTDDTSLDYQFILQATETKQ